MPSPGRLSLGKEMRCPLYEMAGWAAGPVWTGAENLFPLAGIRSQDLTGRCESPYRLSYPAPCWSDIYLFTYLPTD